MTANSNDYSMAGRFLPSVLLACFVFFVCFQAVAQDTPLPEMATGKRPSVEVTGQQYMVVSAHPLASRIGNEILARGGSAADAGIAVQLALGLVEPQSSGLGGGAFALYYDAQAKRLHTFDGRETAPASVGRYLFRGKDGKPMDFDAASIGGRAVGVPGVPRLLEALHQKFGKLTWREVFSPAIALSQDGFEVTPRLAAMLRADRDNFYADVKTKLVFYPDSSTPLRSGQRLRNPDYTATLANMATQGANYFYEGEMPEKIVELLRTNRASVGNMTLEDFSAYRVVERPPVCGVYRGYTVCSMGEPSSGGIALLQILGMVSRFDLNGWGKDDPRSWHVIAEASRLAFADRNAYVADPDQVRTPGMMLLQPDYLAARSALINEGAALRHVAAGTPPGWALPEQSDNAMGASGTSHITIVDAYGNILSMTTSIERAFGSHLMVGGVLLNSQLTDFAFEEGMANSPAGGKRPRSSMTPVIIFDLAGNPVYALGSAGGSAIIGYVAQRVIGLIDWDMTPAQAMAMPNIVHRGKVLEAEADAPVTTAQMAGFGHPMETRDLNSGLTVIQLKGGQITGAADPRREGVAIGR